MAKTKYIGLRVDEGLYNFLQYVLKNIAPLDPKNPTTMSGLIEAILKRFWLEYMLEKTKPSMAELEKEFMEKFGKKLVSQS
jgi:hypothetical protein